MLKAYSIYKDLTKEACDIIEQAGIELELSNSNKRPTKEELINLLKNYDILIIGIKEYLTEDMLEGITTNKIIATLSIGVDHIDKNFANSELITIVNAPTANVTSVAEHIFALILALKKKIIESNEITINGKHKRSLTRRGKDINGSTLGIIGAGKISREVIKIAKIFNMEIYCNTLHPEQHKDLEKNGVKFVDLDTLLSNCDIITANIPLTDNSNNLISKEKIKLMKKDATFINTSRSKIVDVEELIKYADENETFNVGLDIDIEDYEELLKIRRNNVIVTPHIAGVTRRINKKNGH